MAFGFRRPSFRKSIAARTSMKRFVRQSLGFKAPRGWGWLTNPRKAAYNRIYNRTTFDMRKGCMLTLMVFSTALLASGIAVAKGVLILFNG